MTAVIYARYSSDNQREESIEGQIRECTAYAEKNGITVVKHYIDRAISAKTDNHPQFQQMIKDSERGLFDTIIVWKLDRFARNRYDSARYKTQLKKNGVKLMSATEIISEGPDAIPPIIPLELFEDVQEKIAKNKKAPARRKAEDDYLLTTKLFCGCCGALMFGESGVSHTGKAHHYYKCATAKKKKTCAKKTVRKQWLEDLVVAETMKLVEDDASMNAIIAKVMELQNKENTNIPLYEKQLRDAESGIQNMLNAIQAGILTSSTKERLEQLEETKRELEIRIAEEKLAKPKMKEEFVRFWLLRFRKLDMSARGAPRKKHQAFCLVLFLFVRIFQQVVNLL